MKIAEYAVAMQSSHDLTQQSSVRERLRIWIDRNPPASPQATPRQAAISDAARQKQASEASAIDHAAHEAENDPKLRLLMLMIEKLTGQKVRIFNASDLKPVQNADMPALPSPEARPAPPVRAGFGVEYDKTTSYSESETTSLQATGIIKTADGKEIQFNLSLVMQRQYSETSRESIRLGDARKTDPLVINFNGTASQLSEQRFAFDLNADGKNEQVNALLPGSGFLALDKNSDGKINNGSELFGPATGNGFSELAQYDQDGNGWIDESDAVYSQLKVWTGSGSENSRLDSLSSLGVGAILLGSIESPFDIKTSTNQLLGSIRASSIFLNEDGSAGSVQQIDLTV